MNQSFTYLVLPESRSGFNPPDRAAKIESKRWHKTAIFASCLMLVPLFWVVLGAGKYGRLSTASLQDLVNIIEGPGTELDEVILKNLQRAAREDISGEIMETALKIRLCKSLCEQQRLPELQQTLQQRLFPWLKTSQLEDLQGTGTHEKGIVICAGDKYFPFAVHLIRSLSLFNTTLPVEVFYLGKEDLKPESIDFLHTLDQVTPVDITEKVDNRQLDLHGWDIKPFAVLVSSFQQVILLDADVVLTQSPNLIFDHPQYAEAGALFFKDRILRSVSRSDYPSWFQEIIPGPHSQKLVNSSMYKLVSDYEQESGLLVIDKERRLWGLLAACALNAPREREELHEKTYGDKESFWLGFEIANEPYEFHEGDSGAIGQHRVPRSAPSRPTGRLCGHLAHFDEKGNPLWFNDGIVRNKYAKKMTLGNFTHIASGGEWMGLCQPGPLVRETPPDQLSLIEQMKDLWDPSPH